MADLDGSADGWDATAQSAAAGLRILVIEDEEFIAMTVHEMIEELGGTVASTVATLADALRAVAEEEFDLVLLDINLHGERSIPVAAALHAAGRPFVFTTGYGLDAAAAEFADAPLVTKPYRSGDLDAAIRRATTV